MTVSLKFFVKWFITFINLVLSIAGALILVTGVFALIFFRNMPEAAAYNLSYVPILIIIFGCVLTAINICGSIDNKICRLSYTVVMAILATLTLVVAIFAFQSSKYVKVTISELLTMWFNDEDLRPQFYGIESSYECCGLTGPESYIGSPPLSCCPYRIDDLEPFICTHIKAYQNGCLDTVSWAFSSVFRRVGKVSIGIAILGFVGSGATLFLLYLRKKR